MEVSRTIMLRLWVYLLLALLPAGMLAQDGTGKYAFRKGRMFIELPRAISAEALDSFVAQYNLHDLQLPEFIRTGNTELIKEIGWHIERSNRNIILLSKIMEPLGHFNEPGERIRFSEKRPTFAERFPAVNNGLLYGHNRFRNKQSFTVAPDSTVVFFLKGFTNARQVALAGSFNDWNPDSLWMKRTDSGWVAAIKMGPGKYWYKFIVDGQWMVDNDNLVKENDGEGNINSIYFRPNYVFRLPLANLARKVSVAGSFNNWRPGELEMHRTDTGWILPLYLAQGTHTYQFVADGNWLTDERNPNRVADGKGGFRSVMALGKPATFTLKGFTDAQSVVLSGSFNNWSPLELPMRKTASGWELSYVLGPGNYTYRFVVDGKPIADPDNPPHREDAPSLLVVDPNYTFRLKGHEQAQRVYFAGDLNKWNTTSLPMKKEGDEWVLPLHLWAGKHRYKFIVDGHWILDPANKLWEQNEHRTGNSILWIGK